MTESPARKPEKGDRMFNFLFKILGPPTVDNALQGCSSQAHELWKKDLEARKRYSREQREKKRAAEQAARDNRTFDVR
ncbi:MULTISPECIES: hypothetical protein [Polymorphospora]|uniref:Uncharacterized protein n=1 Tax=Polymorphospora lycopeni TaxID=3140240 RepID=A0ABV5CM15_9ACTN